MLIKACSVLIWAYIGMFGVGIGICSHVLC